MARVEYFVENVEHMSDMFLMMALSQPTSVIVLIQFSLDLSKGKRSEDCKSKKFGSLSFIFSSNYCPTVFIVSLYNAIASSP